MQTSLCVGFAKAVEVPVEGNPHWPLPADYYTLGTAGRKLARVNAARQRITPGLGARAWAWFVGQYLYPNEDEGFDPMFFDPPLHPPAPFHYYVIEELLSSDRLIVTAPRNSAKSTLLRAFIIWMAASDAKLLIVYVGSTATLVRDSMDRVRQQLEENPRIVDDFGIKGALRVPRAKGSWSAAAMDLKTGTKIRCTSVESGKRGTRAHIGIVDDPEKDLASDDTLSRKSLELKNTILQVVTPMTGLGGRLAIVSTISRTAGFVYSIASPNVPASERDPRFDDYKRVTLSASANGVLIWKERMPQEFLDRMRKELGEDIYSAELQGEPSTSSEAPLKYVSQNHGYSVSNAEVFHDPYEVSLGLETVTYCMYQKKTDTWNRITLPWNVFLGGLAIIISVDLAWGRDPSSDYSVIAVYGVDANGVMFCLDLTVVRTTPRLLLNLIMAAVRKWRARRVGIEAVAMQETFWEEVKDTGQELEESLGYIPLIDPIRHGNMSKNERILLLEPRFGKGTIKFPEDRWHEREFTMLKKQIMFFTPTGRDNNGLDHDDVIDATSMAHVMARGVRPYAEQLGVETIQDRIANGELVDKRTGIRLAEMISSDSFTEEQNAKIMRRKMAREKMMRGRVMRY